MERTMEIRSIGVGVDLRPDGRVTAGAEHALEQARWLAASQGARIVLIHSTREDERWSAAHRTFEVHPTDPQRVGLGDALDSLRAAGIDAEIVMSKEPAWLAIIRQAIREDLDLVMAGTRAEVDNDGRPLGSVALKLVRKCPCAVWVVKPEAPNPPRIVLAAADRLPVDQRVVEFAAALTSAADGVLHVVRTFQIPLSVQLDDSEALQRFRQEQLAEHERELESWLSASNATAHVHVGVSSPARAVLEGVESLGADLVVMGTIGRGGIPGLLVGNTADRLLGKLDCSIAAVKPADFICPVVAETE